MRIAKNTIATANNFHQNVKASSFIKKNEANATNAEIKKPKKVDFVSFGLFVCVPVVAY